MSRHPQGGGAGQGSRPTTSRLGPASWSPMEEAATRRGTDEKGVSRAPIETWWIPPQDDKGHAARVQFRVPPVMDRQASVAFASGRFPYRTKSDLYRHALHRHLQWLEEQAANGVPRSVIKQVDMIISLLRDEAYHSDFEEVLTKLAERVSVYLGQGATGEARRLVNETITLVVAMPEGYWRDRYEAEIRKRYGHILDSGRAQLADLKTEEQP